MFNTDSFLNQMEEIENIHKSELHDEEIDAVNNQSVEEKLTTYELKSRIETIIKNNDIKELEEILELIVKTDQIRLVKNKIDLLFYVLITFSIEYKVESSVMFSMAKDNYFIVDTAINLLKMIKKTPKLVDSLVKYAIDTAETESDNKFAKEMENVKQDLPLNLLLKNGIITFEEKYFILYYEMLNKGIRKSTKDLIEIVITPEYIQKEFNIIDINQTPIITIVAKTLLTDKTKLSNVYNNLMEKIDAKF